MLSFLEIAKKSFFLDLRSLSLFRICLGLTIIIDLFYGFVDPQAFFSDAGLIPRQFLIEKSFTPRDFSLYLVSGSLVYIWFLFALHFLFGLMLTIGYKTRLATIMCLLFSASLYHRNYLVFNSGAEVLRLILIISSFLPLNYFFSVDSQKKKTVHSFDFFSFWSLAFMGQVLIIYVMSSFFKSSSPAWSKDFSLIFYISRVDFMLSDLGAQFQGVGPLLGELLTRFTYFFEIVAPAFFVFSFLFFRYWWIVKVAIISLFLFFHFCLFLFLEIGTFGLTCMTIWIPFLPGPLWDYVSRAKFLRNKLNLSSLVVDAQTSSLKKRGWLYELVGCLVFLLILNSNLKQVGFYKSPDVLNNIERMTTLTQSWRMMSGPVKYDSWLEVIGTFKDETQVELLSGDKNISSVKSDVFLSRIKEHRWKNFFLKYFDKSGELGPVYARYLCRSWNVTDNKKKKENPLMNVVINLYKQDITPAGEKGSIRLRSSCKLTCY